MKKQAIIICWALLTAFLVGCYPEEELNVPVNQPDNGPMTELDQYIEQTFTDEYGMAIRYRFVDRYIQPTQRVTPPRLDNVRPMLDFIEDFWIEPFLDVANGE